MAERTVLNKTTKELYEANIRKNYRANRTGRQYDGKEARHLSMKDVERRRHHAMNKEKEKEAKQAAKKAKREEAELAKACKDLMRLGPDLVGPPSEFLVPVIPFCSRSSTPGPISEPGPVPTSRPVPRSRSILAGSESVPGTVQIPRPVLKPVLKSVRAPRPAPRKRRVQFVDISSSRDNITGEVASRVSSQG
ncbi:hypothetical protein MMC07_007432, partial [Pseudocyphellaria aurata]|nr:hypothetical protein [Pseudocyphellaria aurata]